MLSGISELLINAIEHGNLNISYTEKSDLKKNGQWRNEIEHRLRQDEFKNKSAKVKYSKNKNSISITVTDQGMGFDWKKYMEFSPDRAFDCNGRGIAMSNALSFDQLLYNDCGNEVTAIVKIWYAISVPLKLDAQGIYSAWDNRALPAVYNIFMDNSYY